MIGELGWLVGFFFFASRLGVMLMVCFYRCCPDKIGFLGLYICLFRRSLAGHPGYTSMNKKQEHLEHGSGVSRVFSYSNDYIVQFPYIHLAQDSYSVLSGLPSLFQSLMCSRITLEAESGVSWRPIHSTKSLSGSMVNC